MNLIEIALLEFAIFSWMAALVCDVLTVRKKRSWQKFSHIGIIAGTFLIGGAYFANMDNKKALSLEFPDTRHLILFSLILGLLCSLFRLYVWKTKTDVPESLYWLTSLVLVASASWALDSLFIQR